jgi:hypothetical protein
MAKTPYERVKEWRKRNPHARTEEARRYRATHPDKVKATSHRFLDRHRERLRPIWAEQARARRKNDPEGQRRRTARWKAKREAKLAEIAGRPRPSSCDLCGGSIGGIVFDHCHAGGHFRGWLCDRCNKVLGLVKDSPKLLRAMAKYVERSNGKIKSSSKESASFFDLCVAKGEKVPGDRPITCD